jgi:hypothetical protein
MFSDADVANQALGHLGVGDEIQNLTTDASKEAAACRRFLSLAREEALRDFAWPFATRVEDLALVTDFTDVDGAEWNFAYRYPATAVTVRRILNGSSRKETTGTRVAYRILSDAAGRLIYTDQEDAQVEYTLLVTDTALYPVDVVDTIALLLASKMAPRFGPDAVKLGDRAFKLYEYRRRIAQMNAANEEQPDQPPDADIIAARD